MEHNHKLKPKTRKGTNKMRKNDFIRELASMVIISNKSLEQDPGHGIYLDTYWLTPGMCYHLSKIIEEVNNEDYGEGNWELDKEAIKILERAAEPSK